MIISRTGLLISVIVGLATGLGGLSVSIMVLHEEPLLASVPYPVPQIVQPQIDEGRIADLVAQKMIAADEARIAEARGKAKKADCAFWGKRMDGCS